MNATPSFCPRCGSTLAAGASYCPKCQAAVPRAPCPATEPAVAPASGKPEGAWHVSILGYTEWYAVYWKIAIRVDGALVGYVGPNERLELDLDKQVVDITVAYLGFGKERRQKTTMVHLSRKTVLQVKTSRWTGSVWIEKVGEIQ